MRSAYPAALSILFLVSVQVVAQDSPQRDLRAVAVLQQSFAAMGGTVPNDYLATGTIRIEAGGATKSGTVRILTRGLDQTLEEIHLAQGPRKESYSRGLAVVDMGNGVRGVSMEWAATAQSPCNPLSLVAGALASQDTVFQYAGLEELETRKAHHIRFWNSYRSVPELTHIAKFSARDIWIDAATGMPLKVAYQRSTGSGTAPSVRIEVSLADYRNVGGLLFPFRIDKALNGTPWAKITIETVSLNNGLSDSDFSVEEEPS